MPGAVAAHWLADGPVPEAPVGDRIALELARWALAHQGLVPVVE
jgi:hypothetical protein